MNLNMDRGPTRNMAAEHVASLRGDRVSQRAVYTADYGVVEHFDHALQTADIRLLCDPASQTFRSVPILGSGGSLRTIWNLKGRDANPLDPDVGTLFFPRLDMRLHNLGSPDLQFPASKMTHQPFKPFFAPGIPYETEPDADAIDSAFFPAGSTGWTDRDTGAGLVMHSDGSMDLRFTSLYLLNVGQTRANASPVARQGDAGDGMGGAIAGGSSYVRSG